MDNDRTEFESTIRRTAGPSEIEWEIYRPLITQLYQDEDRNLKEVMEVLDDLGFKATVKMWKSRVTKWGLDKNMKRSEMYWAGKLFQARRRQGKSTRLSIRGRAVDESKVRRYFKRQKTTVATDVTMFEQAATPPCVTYGTPESEKLKLPQMTGLSHFTSNFTSGDSGVKEHSKTQEKWGSSDYLLAHEPVARHNQCPEKAVISWPVDQTNPQLQAFRVASPQLARTFCAQKGFPNRYETVHNMLAAGQCFLPLAADRSSLAPRLSEQTLQMVNWYLHDFYSYSDSLEQYSNLANPSQMIEHFEAAVKMFKRGNSTDAGILLDSVFQNIALLLRQQHPQLLTAILVLIIYLGTTKFSKLVQLLLKHLYEMGYVQLGPSHPLTNIIPLLAQSAAIGGDSASEALELVVSVCNSRVRQLHPVRLETLYNYAFALLRLKRSAQALLVLEELRTIYGTYGEAPLVSRLVLYSLEFTHRGLGNLDTAENLLKERQATSELIFGSSSPVDLKIHSLRLQVGLAQQRSDLNEVARLGRLAWNTALSELPEDHPTVLLLEQDVPYEWIKTLDTDFH